VARHAAECSRFCDFLRCHAMAHLDADRLDVSLVTTEIAVFDDAPECWRKRS